MAVLMIVESPTKAKKFNKFFPDFRIVSTVGHFKELPPKELGVLMPGHKPQWVVIPGKANIESTILNAANKADVIYVATDPDREGEAIAGHVVNLLGKKHESKISRITYTEVTKAALLNAIENKRKVDWLRVKSQEARRVLDRYIGYLVSPELSKKFNSLGYSGFVSAGRVQSVAVRLVVERQQEIDNFVPVDHYGLVATLEYSGIKFPATWKPALPQHGLMTDRTRAETVKAQTKSLSVDKYNTVPKKVQPPVPLTTSRYVQLMSSTLKVTTKVAMDLAQKLHEVGLITYHRTDSVEMSPAFIESVRGFALKNHLSLPPSPRIYSASDAAQAGHECLRVCDINLLNIREAGVDDELLGAAYSCIWKISLESQLSDGIDENTTAEFLNENNEKFIAEANSVKLQGWRGVSQKFVTFVSKSRKSNEKADDDTEAVDRLPTLEIGQPLSVQSIKIVAKKTKAPVVYNETTLVKKMETLGIGRPSTYASTIERIIAMNYVTRTTDLKFVPTQCGIAVTRSAQESYSFLEYKYTATLEKSLDLIAVGKESYEQVVENFYSTLLDELNKFNKLVLPQEIQTHIKNIAANFAPKKNFEKSEKREKAKKNIHLKHCAGQACPVFKKGTGAVKILASGQNVGKHFIGCDKFPSCKFFSWGQ